MATNFRITLQENSDILYLKLDGDFDGSSAYELLNILENRCRFVSKAFIHTNGLRHIYSFGSSFFRNHLSALKHCKHMSLEFTGDHTRELAPDGAKLH
jgi:anti-anti-sigma regulatory factor